MISWRFALLAVLTAAVVAGCITYFVVPVPPPVEPVRPTALPPAPQPPKPNWEAPAAKASDAIDQPGPKDKRVAAFEQAADAILRRATSARAFAEERPITGPIPLPRKRPIPR
jgi:hypothetical protein